MDSETNIFGLIWGMWNYWKLMKNTDFRALVEGGDSEFANFTLPTLKAFLQAHSHNVSGNKK